MSKRIRVLVADDSAFMRHIIVNDLLAESDIEIVGAARDGLEAVEKVKELSPDVLTLDIEMPRLDGLAALQRIMAESPCRVVMLSSSTRSGAEATLEALQNGAIDFVPKPSGPRSLDMHRVKDELLAKVRNAASVRLRRVIPGTSPSEPATRVKRGSVGSGLMPHERLVVVGCSTGGPPALHELIPRLPPDLPAAFLVVQHMPAGFTRTLAERLDKISAMSVKEARQNDPLTVGSVLIAPGDFHMLVGADERVMLDSGPRVHGVRPAVDITLRSAARVFGRRCVGVILTGMGCDGRDGCGAVKAAGGATLVEDDSSCAVYGMPRSVAEAGLADRIAPIAEIAHEISAMIR